MHRVDHFSTQQLLHRASTDEPQTGAGQNADPCCRAPAAVVGSNHARAHKIKVRSVCGGGRDRSSDCSLYKRLVRAWDAAAARGVHDEIGQSDHDSDDRAVRSPRAMPMPARARASPSARTHHTSQMHEVMADASLSVGGKQFTQTCPLSRPEIDAWYAADCSSVWRIAVPLLARSYTHTRVCTARLQVQDGVGQPTRHVATRLPLLQVPHAVAAGRLRRSVRGGRRPTRAA